jgi:hypothetical protein
MLLQLVDAVSPKADEDLLELMLRIAENPSEWQQVHHELRKYRISIQELKSEVESHYFYLLLMCRQFVTLEAGSFAYTSFRISRAKYDLGCLTVDWKCWC